MYVPQIFIKQVLSCANQSLVGKIMYYIHDHAQLYFNAGPGIEPKNTIHSTETGWLGDGHVGNVTNQINEYDPLPDNGCLLF
jgi:hypothetical protein